MPFMYKSVSGVVQPNFTTSGTPNTELDFISVKPGAARTLGLNRVEVMGKGAGLTTLSGIAFRLKKWTTGGSSGGVSITPTPTDHSAKAAAHTVASCNSANITAGTGGPTFLGSFGCGGTGPGGWVAMNPDDVFQLEAGNNQSMDLWAVSGTASLNWEATVGTQE